MRREYWGMGLLNPRAGVQEEERLPRNSQVTYLPEGRTETIYERSVVSRGQLHQKRPL